MFKDDKYAQFPGRSVEPPRSVGANPPLVCRLNFLRATFYWAATPHVHAENRIYFFSKGNEDS